MDEKRGPGEADAERGEDDLLHDAER